MPRACPADASMASSILGLALAVHALTFCGLAQAGTPPNAYAANSGVTPGHCAGTPHAGLVIDTSNVSQYECYLASAVIFAVHHGFKIRVTEPQRIDWPRGYKEATEKYSPQVSLDSDDNIAHYVAGMPFPLVNVYDPKAARKIAYNWHMGPVMPDDFTLSPWMSSGYSASTRPAARPIDSEPDQAFLCDRFSFLRFEHRTQIEPRPTLEPNSERLEWKARCDSWNNQQSVHGGATIWLRALDPRTPDESYTFNNQTRRIGHQAASPPYLNHECRSCHQPYWAYALPKTEAYSYRLLGTTPILGCITADDEPAGFAGRDRDNPTSTLLSESDTLALSEEPFEMRSAYIIEMIPTDDNYMNLRTLIWIDSETYIWLGAEFFESNARSEVAELQEVAAPLWRIRPAAEGGSLFDLAGSFYVPLAFQPALTAHSDLGGPTTNQRARLFFRSVVPAHGPFDQKINTGAIDDQVFNPRSLGH